MSDAYPSKTYKVRTPIGNTYVMIARNGDGGIKRIHAWCGKAANVNIMLDALCHLAKRIMEEGVPEQDVARMLCGHDDGWALTYFPKGTHGPENRVKSLPDVLGKIMLLDGGRNES